MLKGKARYYTVDDCPIWEFLILGESSPLEWFGGSFTKGKGVNEKDRVVTITGTKGTIKKFRLDFITCEVVEVLDA